MNELNIDDLTTRSMNRMDKSHSFHHVHRNYSARVKMGEFYYQTPDVVFNTIRINDVYGNFGDEFNE